MCIKYYIEWRNGNDGRIKPPGRDYWSAGQTHSWSVLSAIVDGTSKKSIKKKNTFKDFVSLMRSFPCSQMISELKGTTDHNHWALQTPPSSPSSLGSRKSSMCSLGSIHSSSSGSVASHSQVHKFFLFHLNLFNNNSQILNIRTSWWIRLVM